MSEHEVWVAMQQVYAGFLAGRPGDVDVLLHDDVTVWDSGEPRLAHGLAALQELRDRRPAAGEAPGVVAIEATEPVLDVWGDTALLRHLLSVRFSDGSAQHVRNTSVWRRTDGRWLAVHNHEDVLAP